MDAAVECFQLHTKKGVIASTHDHSVVKQHSKFILSDSSKNICSPQTLHWAYNNLEAHRTYMEIIKNWKHYDIRNVKRHFKTIPFLFKLPEPNFSLCLPFFRPVSSVSFHMLRSNDFPQNAICKSPSLSMGPSFPLLTSSPFWKGKKKLYSCWFLIFHWGTNGHILSAQLISRASLRDSGSPRVLRSRLTWDGPLSSARCSVTMVWLCSGALVLLQTGQSLLT